jgi:hypothetical protein
MQTIRKVLKIGSREIPRTMIRGGRGEWQNFLKSYDLTCIRIKHGGNSTIYSVLHYHMRYRPLKYRNNHSRKISRSERIAYRMVCTQGKSKWR